MKGISACIPVILIVTLSAVNGTAQNPETAYKGFRFSGRLRMNYLKNFRTGDCADYSPEKLAGVTKDGKLYDPKGIGFGVGLTAATPAFHGIRAVAAFYSSEPFGMVSNDDARYARSGKDVFYNKRNPDGTKSNVPAGMYVFGQAYLSYTIRKTEIKAGRFIFNTPLTSENDSKMIPNTFQGYALRSGDVKGAELHLAYLTRQKLRDRLHFHSLIRYGTSDGDTDDTDVHKGLTGAALRRHGVTATHMVVAGIAAKVHEKTDVQLYTYFINKLLNTTVLDVHYRIPLHSGVRFTPGLRLLKQHDLGMGETGGAYRNGSGTRKAGAANSVMGAVRVVAEFGSSTMSLGFSCVEDRGDIIAPWRGFPTTGYTRTMAAYNWDAGTRSYMYSCRYDFDKAGIIDGLTLTFYAARNDRKGLKDDTTAFHTDIVYNPPILDNVQMKIRALKNRGKAERDFTDFRFEIRRFF